jgi:hypothetical protein
MSTITTNYSNRVQTDYKVENTTPLTDAEIKAKIIEVQNENLKAIEQGLEQNSSGWGDKVKIKVPADAQGRPITNPTAKDWENAAKNNSFADFEDRPYRLASNFFSVNFADFGDHAQNLIANQALLEELQEALNKGISFPASPIPKTVAGDIVRAFQARQAALNQLKIAIGNPNAGVMNPPAEKIDIKVPAGPDGKPIKNPSPKDWIEAQKNNRWSTVSGKPADLAADYYGVKIDTANWRDSYKSNIAALEQSGKEGSQKFIDKIRSANGEFVIDEILDIPDAGKIIAEVLAVLGPAYGTELEKADNLRKQMDSLKKKNQALEKLENSISDNDTSGGNNVDFEVPTKRFVYDSNGNKVLDANGKQKTEDITPPASDLDWAQAAEWKSIKELNGGNDVNGRKAAEVYLGFKLVRTEGDNAHNNNLSTNLQKINNARTSVSSEMSKLSGQFDFRMGNAQTNLQNANKIIASINDMVMGITKSI